jgi:hypothetical protein
MLEEEEEEERNRLEEEDGDYDLLRESPVKPFDHEAAIPKQGATSD